MNQQYGAIPAPISTPLSALPAALLATLLICLGGCSDHNETVANNGMRQTNFPGMVTSGGGSSGDVIARAGKASDGKSTGGTATAASVQESGHGPAAGATAPAKPNGQ